MHDLASFRKIFDKRLEAFLLRKKNEIGNITRQSEVRKIITHTMKLAAADGKRIRPYLGYLGYCAAGGRNPEHILDALVGLELFHVFALIHDDIIDQAVTRRGIPTTHAHLGRRFGTDARAKHKALSQAILAGDLVYVWAHEALLGKSSAAQAVRTMSTFYEMIEEVVVGQMIDVDITGRLRIEACDLAEKNLLKTARYTFTHPLRIGAALAGSSKKFDAFFVSFGDHAGSAFQIGDDLLDVVGDPRKTGKALFSDIREGQHTHLTLHVSKKGSACDRAEFSRAFGKKYFNTKTLLATLNSSGAIEHARSQMKRHLMQARNEIQKAPLGGMLRGAFVAIADLLETRVS